MERKRNGLSKGGERVRVKIGIDISSLQGPHRMRGIGYVARNFIRNIPSDDSNSYIFYIYKNKDINEKNIFKDITLKLHKYEFRYIGSHSHLPQKWKQIKITDKIIIYAGKIKIFIYKALRTIFKESQYKIDSKRFDNVKDLDVFIQLDQSAPLPILKKDARNYFIAYDIIPYVLEGDYLWGYKTARKNGLNIKSSIKKTIERNTYLNKLKHNSEQAYKLLAISQATKNDFIKYVKVPSDKIEVILLGADNDDKFIGDTGNKPGIVDRYLPTQWGYITKKCSLMNKRFLLFVGGVDPRRKLNDVVSAFNHLKARGEDIKLVLSGDIMTGPHSIPILSARESLLTSSYLDDVYFLGFTDDKTRNWLYNAALAFIFPSVYEGFGLPVLEAMRYHTPVIAYASEAVVEVAGDCPIYAHDTLSIVDSVKKLERLNQKELKKLTDKAFRHSNYTWGQTVKNVLNIIEIKHK